jgi:hypothetical protein
VRRTTPRTGHLWFDLGGLVTPDLSDDERELVVRRSRQLGLGRILFRLGQPARVAADNPPSYEQWPWVSALPFTTQSSPPVSATGRRTSTDEAARRWWHPNG